MRVGDHACGPGMARLVVDVEIMVSGPVVSVLDSTAARDVE
jgi:hypothetical protein